MYRKKSKQELSLYVVNPDGEACVPKLGWALFEREMASDKDHQFTGCRWAIVLTDDGKLLKVYEGHAATLIGGRDTGPLRLRGRDVATFVQNVNRRLGHTDEDVRAILASISLPS